MPNDLNIVLFDGVCNLCNSTVSFLIKYDAKCHLHFAAQQTQAGKDIMTNYGIENEQNSVIFIKGKQVYYQSDAIIEIAKLISGWPRLLRYSYLIPSVLRNGVYDIIAKNRYKIFGKRTSCAIPKEEDKNRFL